LRVDALDHEGRAIGDAQTSAAGRAYFPNSADNAPVLPYLPAQASVPDHFPVKVCEPIPSGQWVRLRKRAHVPDLVDRIHGAVGRHLTRVGTPSHTGAKKRRVFPGRLVSASLRRQVQFLTGSTRRAVFLAVNRVDNHELLHSVGSWIGKA